MNWEKAYKPSDILNQGFPCSDEESVDTLLKIINSRKLKGSCVEKIGKNIETNKFCCVTDIPLKDLHIHSKYYGQVAIGFSSKEIHENFQPVIYVPIQRVSKKQVMPDESFQLMSDIEMHNSEGNYECSEFWTGILRDKIVNSGVVNEEDFGALFKDFVKFTAFSNISSETFYSEREWRHVGNYKFKADALAAIIAPEKYLGKVKEYIYSHQDYKDNSEISLLSWEFVQNC